jgi:hypothetical protein
LKPVQRNILPFIRICIFHQLRVETSLSAKS